MKRSLAILLCVGVLLAGAMPAAALINPRFTPIDLVGQATLVAVVKPAAPDAKDKLTVDVVKCLVGNLKAPADKITIELLAEWAKPIAADIARHAGDPALLFVGTGEDKNPLAYLHQAGQWLRLEAKGDGAFVMTKMDTDMRGTWAGGTDMLLRCVEYILSDQKSADVPVAAGCTWADRKLLGKIDGPVNSAQAIDLAGQGQIALFVAADNGDRVYRCDETKKDFADVTATLKLASKSKIAAWADFTGAGRGSLDLASWDGKTLTLWAQSGDGTFPPKGVPMSADLRGECLGLSILDAGVPGKPGLLVSTPAGPVLLVPQKDGSFKATPLDSGGADRKKLGPPGACLAADFDGDGIADVLEPFAESSLFYKGLKVGGTYAAAVKCDVAQGKGTSIAWLGDYAGDGRLDVFMSGADVCRLWHNRGEMKFEETFSLCGEPAYMAQRGAVCGQTCDINNDGRQDILIAYRESIPMLFFNRGFRSLGKALEITEDNVIPEANVGVQAAVVEDFNGDGAQDMAVVLTNGEVRMFVRSGDEPAKCLGVRVALPLGKGKGPIGPVSVTGWAGKRCLGAWNVTSGSPGALIARAGAGNIVLKWQLPGEKPVEKKITLIDKPVRFVLEEPKE